jgi:hypothetical protein
VELLIGLRIRVMLPALGAEGQQQGAEQAAWEAAQRLETEAVEGLGL